MAQRKPKPKPDKKQFERFEELAKRLVAVPKDRIPKSKADKR
jgi:hypothetical protein